MVVEEFTFSNFIKSVLWLAFWILLVVSLIGLPIVFVAFFFIEPPVVGGIEVTPYLLLTMLTNPQVGAPLIRVMLESPLFRVAVFPGFGFASIFATLLIFYERKFLAKMQIRVGPHYAGREALWWIRQFGGFPQLIADLLKLLGKEIIIPAAADKPLFIAAPVILLVAAAGLASLVPVGPGWVVANIDVGVLVMFALLGLFPLTALLASWASNSKYPFIGGLRALHQLIAYEIPLFLSVLGVVILAGTLNFLGIVEAQEASTWFLFLLPIGAFIFFITALAELERVPFDIPEAESEIVAGWLTEYTGMAYGLIQLANYVKLYVLAGIFVTLFMGGWTGPTIFNDIDVFGTVVLTGEEVSSFLWFSIKTFGVAALMILPRGINPRIRIDILLRTGWAKLIGLAFVNIFIAVGLIYAAVIPFT